MKPVKIGKWEPGLPKTKFGRIVLGSILIVLGFLGFLPVIGFWMIPLGILVLSEDLPLVRRGRRRVVVWYERQKRKRNGEN